MSLPVDPVHAAVIGATGATGIHLDRELLARGTQVRVLSRSAEHLQQAFADLAVEQRVADATDSQAVRAGIEGCDVVFDCGANVGDVTAPLAATGATVHAFEPDPFAFGQLSRRTSSE